MHKLHRGERPNPRFSTLRLIALGYGKPVSEIAAMLGDGNGRDARSHRRRKLGKAAVA